MRARPDTHPFRIGPRAGEAYTVRIQVLMLIKSLAGLVE